MEALRDGVRADGGRRRRDRARRLPDRQRDQRRLCRQESAGHHRAGVGHRGDLPGQGALDLRLFGDAGEDRQPHRRAEPAADVQRADQSERRVLFGAAFLRIHGAADHRRHRREPCHQPAHHRDRPRPALADRACGRDGGARPDHVVLQFRRGAAGLPGAAQDDPPHLQNRPQPVHRRHAHSGNHAGDGAGHPHRESLHARRRDARAARKQRHGPGERIQQVGAGGAPRQPADGSARRLCDRRRADLRRLAGDRDRRDAGAVLLVPRRLHAGLRAGQAAGAPQHRPQHRAGRRPHPVRDHRHPADRTQRRRQAGAEDHRGPGRI